MKKTKIRIFAFVLSTIMAFPIFASCNKENENVTTPETTPETTTEAVNELTEPTVETTLPKEETTTETQETEPVPETTEPPYVEPTVEMNLSKYRIVISSDAAESIVVAASDIYDTVKEKTGKALYLKRDGKYPAESSNGYEILIGYTNRHETKEFIETFDKEKLQWGITLKGNKIVIAGNNDLLTSKAVEYFIENYVADISQNAVINVPEVFHIQFTEENYSKVSLSENGSYNFKIVINKNLTEKDFLTNEAKQLASKLNDLIGTDDMQIVTDDRQGQSDAKLSREYEILVGKVDRVESTALFSALGFCEYGYALIGRKFVITGWSDDTVDLAIDMFLSDISKCVSFNAENQRDLELVYEGRFMKVRSGGEFNIPNYANAYVAGFNVLNDNGAEYYVKDTNLDEYLDYCKVLESVGYKEYFSNATAGNVYTTYISSDYMVHVYFNNAEKGVRVIVVPMELTELPNIQDEKYEKVTESAVTQMIFDYPEGGPSGMCYIFTLEDGSFILYDIGHRSDVDAERLYRVLDKLNKRKDNQIVIAAWVMTHAHGDHIGNFNNFCKKYGDRIKIEQVICNSATDFSFRNLCNNVKAYVGPLKIVTPHTGQIIKVRNAEIEVLFTVEDIYPVKVKTLNDTSLVTRVKLGGQTVMMLGDAESQTSDIMIPMYGTYLKSDIVQISHHGYGTASFELYELIDSDVALWPAYQEVYDMLLDPNVTGAYYVMAKQLVANNMFVDTFLADYTIKTLVLPYKAGSGAVIEHKF